MTASGVANRATLAVVLLKPVITDFYGHSWAAETNCDVKL